MHPYSFLKVRVEAIALPAGFALLTEEHHPDDSAAINAFASSGTGRMGVGFAETQVVGDRAWNSVGRVLGEGEIEGRPQDVEAIAAWESELREALS